MDETRITPDITDLVTEHYQLVFRYVYRLSGSNADAEDLTQQAFLVAHKRIDQLREPNHAKSWLCTIVRNLYLKSLRNVQPSVSLDQVAEPTGDEPFEGAIDSEELQNILDEMPEEFRAPVVLFYFEEFSYKEISEQLDVPLGTVMSRLSRGKEFLRTRLTSSQSVTDHTDSTESPGDTETNDTLKTKQEIIKPSSKSSTHH